MKILTNLLWIFLLLTTSVFANEETLPFIQQKMITEKFVTSIPLQPVPDYNKALTHFPAFNMETKKASNLPTGIIVDTITKTKAVICQAAKGGSVKVYFSIDASGKFLGIGASSEAGIEITFNC